MELSTEHVGLIIRAMNGVAKRQHLSLSIVERGKHIGTMTTLWLGVVLETGILDRHFSLFVEEEIKIIFK
jgi:hypothetical protein